MPSQISRGYTFTDGTTGNSSNLHALVDSGTILPGLIGEQANAAPADGDSFLIRQAANTALKKCTLLQIRATIPSGTDATTASLRKLGTAATMAAPGNDVRFPANITGVRKGNNGAPDTVAKPVDTSYATKVLTGATNTVIDWDLANVFYDDMVSNKTYTFINVRDGRSIQIILKKNGRVATLPATIGTVVVGSGTTFLHVFLTKTAGGTTGLQIAI